MGQLDIPATNAELKPLSAEQRIAWAVERFGSGVVLLSSMQWTSSVLMSMFFKLGLDNEVLFVDTGYHFHETLALRDLFLRRYRLNLVTLYPGLTHEQQEQKCRQKMYRSRDGQQYCCRQRKERPFIEHLLAQGKKVVCNGLRAREGGKRRYLPPLAADPRFGGYALHPILEWSDEQVRSWLDQHRVPIHPLHSCRYPSIGCECCTTPVAPGEDARAGRWRHLRPGDEPGPRYCGINYTDGGGI